MPHFSLLALLSLFPALALAQTLSAQSFIARFLQFSNNVLIPFMLGIAFLFFIINVIRFFVVGGANEDSRKNARGLALFGVLAFVVIVIFWGVVNLLSSSIGLDEKTAPVPDYVQINSAT